jgi:hypothetical protein
MNGRVVYEIARYHGSGDDATLLQRVQLLSAGSALWLRDATGNETPCNERDIVAAIAARPDLREIHEGQEARITCEVDIAAQLPLVLAPVLDRGDYSECSAEVNGAPWSAFRSITEDYVVLPGYSGNDEGPAMNPCWAEHGVSEGEWNPLTGHTSIGLVTPGVVAEYGRYDVGGIYGESAVAIRPFDDSVTAFVDWLANTDVLEQIWGGDSAPPSPTISLFAAAATAADRTADWSTVDDQSDDDETEYDEDSPYCASADLVLHLSDTLIDQIRARLISRDAAYAAAMQLGAGEN